MSILKYIPIIRRFRCRTCGGGVELGPCGMGYPACYICKECGRTFMNSNSKRGAFKNVLKGVQFDNDWWGTAIRDEYTLEKELRSEELMIKNKKKRS